MVKKAADVAVFFAPTYSLSRPTKDPFGDLACPRPAVSVSLQPKSPKRKEPLIQDSAGGRKAGGNCFLQNTSETVVVAAAEGKKQGFLTFLLRRVSCKSAVGSHALLCQSWLPSPAAFVFCVLFSLILEFYKSLMLWKMEKQRKRKSHTVILTADLFSHKMEL